jgi:threonine aldolase
MDFSSDNWSGATPAVMEALNRENARERFAAAYGNDSVTAGVRRTFTEVFEREVEVFFVSSGTAANTLSMAAVSRAAGFVLCTEEAHLQNDEFNATEFFTGMKLVLVPSVHGLMQPDDLRSALAKFPEGRSGPPAVLSLTNASELGTIYRPGDVAALSAIAKERGMQVHVDGARFANAVAAAGASPADLTWRAGVDLMSFGGTKNGCIAAEAVVVFNPGAYPDIMSLRQRGGHGLSKQRFIAAQYAGYFKDGDWLKTAGHANAMTARLQSGLRKSNAVRLDWESTTNELFPVMSTGTIEKLRGAGAMFHTWEELPNGEQRVRLVTSWSTTEADVDRFLAAL